MLINVQGQAVQVPEPHAQGSQQALPHPRLQELNDSSRRENPLRDQLIQNGAKILAKSSDSKWRQNPREIS